MYGQGADRSPRGNAERVAGMERERNEHGWWLLRETVNFGQPSFVFEAKQELLRLIVDVQQNRNRPEDLS